MLNEVVNQTVTWAAATGAPNALVVVALLTQPSTWTDRILAFANSRMGGGEVSS